MEQQLMRGVHTLKLDKTIILTVNLTWMMPDVGAPYTDNDEWRFLRSDLQSMINDACSDLKFMHFYETVMQNDIAWEGDNVRTTLSLLAIGPACFEAEYVLRKLDKRIADAIRVYDDMLFNRELLERYPDGQPTEAD